MSPRTIRRPRALLTAAVAALLALTVAGCAPEPGDAAGSIDKETQTTSPETKWGGQDLPEEDLQTTLPESFPSDAFVIPEGAKIYNTGERGTGQWFVVLQAVDATAATTLWDAIVSGSGFAIADEIETTEGGVSAVLSNATLSVQALTIPQEDGSVLLNYDLLQWG